MNFDFVLDNEEDSEFEFGNALLKSEIKNGSKNRRGKRTFEKTFQGRNSAYKKYTRTNNVGDSTSSNPQVNASVDPSTCPALAPSNQSKDNKSIASSVTIEKSIRYRRRKIGSQQEEDGSSNDDDASSFSTRSQVPSSCGASSTSSFSKSSISTVSSYSTIKRNRLSVHRGAGSSVHAVQDAGTYQMIHDECSYLCSTILSKTTRSSKTIDAAIELAILLSSRKTRSILWQGGTHNRDDDNFVDDDNQRIGPSSRSNSYREREKIEKQSPIPKVWSSILEVLALAGTTDSSFDTNSSNFSVGKTTATGSVRAPGMPSTKYRTKSARRKEKALLETGGRTIATTSKTITATTKNHCPVSLKGSIISPVLKDVLACIFYYVSWDCTMSGEHSIAAMGGVKSSAVARRIRLAILERGTTLNGMIRLMAPSEPLAAIATTETTNPSVSPLHATTSTISKPSSKLVSIEPSSSKASISQHADSVIPSIRTQTKTLYSPKKRDPTAMGRRRKNRRKLKDEFCLDDAHRTPSESDSVQMQVKVGRKSDTRNTMLPPSNRSAASLRLRDHRSDELNFDDLSVEKQPFQNDRKDLKANNDANSVASEFLVAEASTFSSRPTQRVDSLRANIYIESLSKSRSSDTAEVSLGRRTDNERSIFRNKILADNCTLLEGDCPWLSIVCLESLTRILTGKELHGKTSCLEEEENSRSKCADDTDNDGIDDSYTNVVMVTNRLIGKSGVIPLLSCAMSQSMKLVTKLVFGASCQKDQNEKNKNMDADDEYWDYCYNRLKLLASLIDEACFFSERNRRSFCEDDPFSFQDRRKGLIFHILMFLHQCSQCNLNQLDQKRSEIMTLALRTLTSLTHDNPLAAEQMEIFNHCDLDFNVFKTEKTIQGIRVLARLVFQLEESSLLDTPKPRVPGSMHLKRASEHDMHRYDGTIFCLTTLANITEGADIGKSLLEILVTLESGDSISWVEWLCHWLIKQTETFRQEILSIGHSKKKNDDFNATTSEQENDDLKQEEEEKLVAAGNGCVVLACLITGSEDRDVDFSLRVRNLIKKQMPFSSDGSPSGLTLVVNTLKAYCNYYHISMGEMSVAVISPVRRLISELEEIVKIDEEHMNELESDRD